MLNERNIATVLKQVHVNVNESKKIFSGKEIRTLTPSWFQLIWGHINKYGNLEDFQGLPLIPIPSGNNIMQIAVLQRESILIFSDKDEDDDVISLFRQLGCTIIKELPSYVLQNSSTFKCKYMYEYLDENLIQLLSNLASELGKKEITRKFSTMNNNAGKLEFLRRISNCTVRGNMYPLLRSLPFIEITNDTRLVSVDECQLIAPRELPDVMPQRMLLKIQHGVQVSFIEKLGGRQLSKREFIEEILLPEIHKSKVSNISNQSMINYILDSIAASNDKQQWQAVINALSFVQFVQSDDGKLYKPTELFRRCERLKGLFVGEKGRFPKIGQNVEVLKLKNESDVSADDIKSCLEKICELKDGDVDKYKKARCILEHLELYQDQDLLQNESLMNKIKDTAWIPINGKRPDVYPNCLTWYGENGKCNFGKLAEMVTKENSNLVGSERAVIPSDIEHFKAIRLIMEGSRLNNQYVIKHLIHIIDNYDRKYRHELMIVLNKIYCYLQAKYDELTDDQVAFLKSMNWVWCDDCFVKPQQVVLKAYELDIRPYVYNLPQELSEINSLLVSCGSVPNIDKETLINVLEAIKQEHEYQTGSRKDVDRDRKMCIEILKALGHMTLSDDDLNRILVPIRCEDTGLMLKTSIQTVYSSLGGFNCEEEYCDTSEGEEDLLFLHECITEDIAKALRIRSLTSRLIGAEDLGMFEEYGQHEPLTRRINRILADYGDGLAIVKEIIQNADDAGAAEVKFLYDERLNKDKQRYLIDPGMKDVQGPALWAYNDAKFSKEDFENIVKLSGATKEDKRDKIGKFGLGFNAVYNITDVPSFISDNQLVILDPHATHLGHAIKNKSKPGVRIPLGPRRNHLRRFEDQIHIYDGVFGMDASLSDGYKMFEGTLFRFPLRTEKQTQMSEIKKLFYSKDEMKALVKKFFDEASRILMFTQNVHTVEFFHLEEDTKNAENTSHILLVSKKMFYPNIENKHLKTNVCESFDIMKQSSLAVESKMQNRRQDFVKSLRHIVDIVTIVKEGSKNFFEAESKYDNEIWALNSSIDDKECMNMALKSPQLNPVASVAVCIEKNEDSKTYKLLQLQPSNSGHFYCFLPLPIPNGLNVHINSTFALSKDRKSFLERSEDDKMHETLETIWNRQLMSGPVSSAYIGLLKDLTNFIDLEDEATWYSLWPQKDIVDSKVCSYNQEMIRSFYHSIIHEKERIFPKPKTRNEWLDWTQIMTIDGSIKYKINGEAIEEAMEKVIYSFYKEKVVAHLPQELLSTLEAAGFKNELSIVVLSFPRFFSHVFMPNVKEMPSQIREIILVFAIHNYSYDSLVSNSIIECECIPTRPNGCLKKPSDLVKPMSKAAYLFEVDEEVFPVEELKDCFGSLMDLGMLSDAISWELLMHRAKTIKELGASKPRQAEARVQRILQIMQERISQYRNDIPDLNWKTIEFLPVKAKPLNWQLIDWEGKKSAKQFASASELYPSRYENMIGCHKLIIDDAITGRISYDIERLLGVRTKLTVHDIIQQVEHISKCINGRKGTELPKRLLEIFDMIYQTLSKRLLSEDSSLEEEIKEGFKGRPVILVNENTLVKAEQVAFHLSFNAKPYLYKLQNRFAMSYRPLMSALGVKKNFCMEDFHRALIAMKSDTQGNPLTDSQLKTVRDLLESIKRDAVQSPKDIFLPDKDKILRQKELVVVKESVWMKDNPSKRYLHRDIPPELALSLGAKTERSHSIASQSRGLPFGQHEKLTVRLKRILEAYPSQIQVLYELLQNADDAGASEVKFILDTRQHPDEKVFGDAWKPLQGPALLVFNDAPFTHQDIEGIQNLGEGSKSDDCQKTGQYGIGFNVVYHVTDAPCLLTEVEDDSVLCVFDPHARFLEECSLEEPGRMFENGRTYLKNTFPDIYYTFLPQFLTNEKSAILRLPLRSASHVLNSSIKQRATTTEEILEMFKSFKDKGPEAIVFLRNVTSVEIYIIDEKAPSQRPHRVFSVHADMTNDNKKALSLFNEDYKSLSSSIKDRSKQNESYQPIQCELTLRTTDEKRIGNASKWKIIQKCASINPKDLPQSLDDQYKNGNLSLIPVGGIAHKIDGSLANGKVYCLLPLVVSSSLPLHINGKFILDYESRRRLWYTSENSFQKTWNYYIIEHCIVPCYVQLLRTLANERNIVFRNTDPTELLQDVFKIDCVHPEQIEAYFRNFPKLRENERSHEYDADLIKMFYKRIANEEVNVMPVLKPVIDTLRLEFVPSDAETNQFYYIDFYSEKDFIRENSANMCIALTNIGVKIYNIPADIVQTFSESDVALKKLTPEVVNKVLKNNAEIILEGQEQLELRYTAFRIIMTVKALLQYCTKDENFSLNGLPLLVTEDGMLRRFDDAKHVYYDEISILFPKKKDMSLHPKLRSSLSKFQGKTSGALRKFMLSDFSKLLDEELNSVFKRNDEIVIADVKLLNRKLPEEHWLRSAWTFLRKQFKEWKQHHIMEESERVMKIREQQPLQSKVTCRTPMQMGLVPMKFLDPISGWCLFPVERHITGKIPSKQYSLVRINQASHAVDAGAEMSHIIDELGLPVPSSLFVDYFESWLIDNSRMLTDMATNTEMLTEMATNTGDLNAFIDALTVECQREKYGFPGLSTDVALDLLRYFSRKAKDIDGVRQKSLRNLPLWEDVSGELKKISSAVECYIISDDMPVDGISILQDRYNVLLLKKHFNLTDFYKKIVAKAQDDAKVYCNLILEHFGELQQQERFAHLSHLKCKYTNRGNLDDDLLEKLRNTKIIEKNGVLAYVRELYDPDIKLFTDMLTKDNFPSMECQDSNWLGFLRILDLVSKISPDLFCSFAERIPQIQERKERKLKSQALIEHLQESSELKSNVTFLYSLSSIPFLVVEELDTDLSRICPAKTEEELICFRDAVVRSEKNIMLSWTIEHILPSYACKYMPLKEFPINELHVVKDVSYHSVASNLENISKSCLLRSVAEGVKAYSKYQKFEDIFDAAYECLHKRPLIEADDAFSVLCRIPLILVNGEMISKARKVTMEKDFDIPPHLFSLPMSLGKFVNLFKKMGMSEKPTIYQLTKVLDGFFAGSNGTPLGPNEANNCLKVIFRLMDVVDESEFPNDIILLPLPGCLEIQKPLVYLHPSQDLVYFDDAHLDERLKHLNMPKLYIDFMTERSSSNESKLTQASISRFIQKLPPALQPKMLSAIVNEIMTDSDTLPNFGFTRDLYNKMKSREFAGCMIRLLKHQKKGCSDGVTVNTKEILELLSRIEVTTKQTVETVLILRTEGIRIEQSECEKDVFVTNQDNRLQIFMSSSVTDKSDAQTAVAVELVSFFGDHFKDPKLSLLVAALLGKEDPKEMHGYLDKQNICRDEDDLEALDRLFYSPGSYVPTELHCLLINDISKFHAGDHVAFEVKDPGLDDDDGDPVYIYAKILECLTEQGRMDFYKIDIGEEEPTVVHKSELYGFYRPDKLKEGNDDEHRSLEEVKESIKRELEEAFKLGEEYAKRIVKRLWLQWHPERNLRNEEYSSEIFKFIQTEVTRLRGDSSDSFWSSGTVFTTYIQRGSVFIQKKRNFCQMGYRGYSWGNGYWRAPNNSKNPQPGEAWRWFRQAKFDLEASRSDMAEENYEWLCFKCHQVRAIFYFFVVTKAPSTPYRLTIVLSRCRMTSVG